MARRLTQVLIDSVDVSAVLLNWRKTTSYGDMLCYAQIEFPRSISTLVTLSNSSTVEIYEGFENVDDVKIFDGYVETYKPDGYKMVVCARDKLADLVRTEVTQVYDVTVVGSPLYPDGKISEVALDIITTQAGLTADATTVQDSGTATTLQKYVCNHADPFERLCKLADSLGWVLYYRADTDKVYFEPRNYTVNATTLTVGDNIVESPRWVYDKSQMINDLTLEGAVQSQPRKETFNGDNSTATFTLTTAEAPAFIDVYLSSSKDYDSASYASEEKKIGVPAGNTVGTFDYTFDLKQGTFTLLSGTLAPTGTNNVLAQYAIETPNPVHRKDSASITEYSLYKKTLPLTDVLNVDDAEARCQKLLQKYSQPFVSGTIKVAVTDSTFRVGQGVSIVDNINSPAVNTTMTIRKITKKWPGNFDEMEVGDAEWLPVEAQVNMLERLKRLEETLIGDTAVVNELVDQNLTIPVAPISRTVLVELVNDSFLLGMDVNGILYDDDETAILQDFEDYTDWTDDGLTQTLSDDSVAGRFWIGTQGVKSKWTDTSGSGSITATLTNVDLSAITGATSGTPSQGTIGLWIYSEDKNIFAWFPFNGSGIDTIGGNNATVTGPILAKDRNGVSDTAYEFNGTTDYIDLGTNSRLDDMFYEGGTVNMWVYIDSAGNSTMPRLISKEENNRGFIFTLSDFSAGTAKLIFAIPFSGTDGRWDSDTRIVTTEAWHMISISYDSSATTNNPIFYVDGTAYSVGSGLTETSTPTGTQTSDDDDKCLLGNFRTDSLIRSFDGRMDDVRLYNFELDSTEIEKLYVGTSTILGESNIPISEMKIRIGNDSSNYEEYIAETYSQRNAVDDSFILRYGLNYLLFDLNSPDATLGNLDWENIDYCSIIWTITAAGGIVFDYLTASKSNDIGLNGLGERATTLSSTTYTY